MEGHAQHVGPGIMEAIQAANLIVVILIVYLAAGKGIAAGVKARAQAVATKLVGSRDELNAARKELDQVKRELAELDQLKKRISSETRSEGEKLAAQMIQDARQTAERILSDAKAAADNEVRSAALTLRDRVVREALKIAKESMADAARGGGNKIHEQLVESFVSELETRTAGAKGGVRV